METGDRPGKAGLSSIVPAMEADFRIDGIQQNDPETLASWEWSEVPDYCHTFFKI